MFKYVVFFALLALAVASPAPEPAPKPGVIAASYAAPLVASAPLAYSSSYRYSPLPYSAYAAAPLAYPYAHAVAPTYVL